AFVEHPLEPEGVAQPVQSGFGRTVNELYDGSPAIESVAVGGPFAVTGLGDSESRRKLFVCRPANSDEERRCATTILSTIARQAYRRPIVADDLVPVLQ